MSLRHIRYKRIRHSPDDFPILQNLTATLTSMSNKGQDILTNYFNL